MKKGTPPKLLNWKPRSKVVMGVFKDVEAADHAAQTLRLEGLEVKLISNGAQLPPIVYAPLEEIGLKRVLGGIAAGAGIGAVLGILLMAAADSSFASPLSGMIAGAIVGGAFAAGRRSSLIHLPDPSDYLAMLADGKSLLAIRGSQVQRIEYAARMQALGAISVYNHPPFQLLRLHPAENTRENSEGSISRRSEHFELTSNLT